MINLYLSKRSLTKLMVHWDSWITPFADTSHLVQDVLPSSLKCAAWVSMPHSAAREGPDGSTAFHAALLGTLSTPDLGCLQASLFLVLFSWAPLTASRGPILQKRPRVTPHIASWVNWDPLYCPGGSSEEHFRAIVVNWFLQHYFRAAAQGWYQEGTEGGTGRQRPGLECNWEERTDGIWRCWWCHEGWDSSDYGETEQTSVVPACRAVLYAPGCLNVLDRHTRLPGRRCDGCSQAGSSSLPWRLHCTYLGLSSQYLN